MADDGEGKNNDRNKTEQGNDKADNRLPEWNETCIGIWTRSTKGEKVKESSRGRICNGISVVKINKFTDPKKVKQSQTRGLQIIIQETDEEHRHEDQEEDPERDPHKYFHPPEDPGIGGRLVDVMRKRKDSVEKSLQHYAKNGIHSTDVWNGFTGVVSSWYTTSARILSYCKPKEKLSQMYSFAAGRLKDFSSKLSSSDKNNKK